MHDIDISVDLARISTRKLIKEYLLAMGITENAIVNDRHSVGDNCISWRTTTAMKGVDVPIRVKLYNKFVQMLESCEVRSQFGSQLSYLVANTDASLQEKLLQYKRHGMTRLEITLYCSKMYKERRYRTMIENFLDFFMDCPTYSVSFKRHWKMVVDRLTTMMVMYIPERKVFAYCHWWNSLTKRKQGLVKSKVSKEQVDVLMANFGYNDRPIHYVEVALVEGKKEEYTIANHIVYRRAEGTTAITMVPGPGNSLFPFRQQLKRPALNFADVGMKMYQNLHLEWPEKRLSRRTRKRALAQIVLWEEEEVVSDEGPVRLEVMDPVVMSKHKADYATLKKGVYLVIAYGYGTFRGKPCVCLKLQDDLAVRCGSELEAVAKEGIAHGDRFFIQVHYHKTVHGRRSLECSMA
jgi:hypothetical protein